MWTTINKESQEQATHFAIMASWTRRTLAAVYLHAGTFWLKFLARISFVWREYDSCIRYWLKIYYLALLELSFSGLAVLYSHRAASVHRCFQKLFTLVSSKTRFRWQFSMQVFKYADELTQKYRLWVSDQLIWEQWGCVLPGILCFYPHHRPIDHGVKTVQSFQASSVYVY